ncbi:uncharacterized protein LOC131695457 [Topomyia yanbarensis]|uniref:uncharacterized protein LOC131694577 n=1 Tax=Topomyia yanbarensis TaxID=2498891 RepID=UPI00273CE7AE|nr:uncharacterized protein LOC131694577 [Topomyia yanbarensis]XP_058839955.1 uncharacterized protein LOC131695457 [Topomyia yanbarensis]
MVWTRPPNPPIPTVWHTFKAKDVDSDRLVTYRVQDLTEDRYEDMIQHFLNHFIEEEPFSVSKGASSNATLREGMIQLWRNGFEEKMTLVCYREGSDEIVGANIVLVKSLDEVYDGETIPCEEQGNFRAILEYVSEQFDVHKHYGVDHRMIAYGLTVNKRYRGRGIATEILKARVPMCKAFGIKLAAHPFSAIGSQKAAINAGYRTDYEITFDELAALGPKYALPGIQSKSLKLMSYSIE